MILASGFCTQTLCLAWLGLQRPASVELIMPTVRGLSRVTVQLCHGNARAGVLLQDGNATTNSLCRC